MNNLVKMTRSAYNTAKTNRTLVTPNVALITDENKVEFLPVNPVSDIGIAAYENGIRTFYSLEQWNALETKPTALGVYVFTEQSQFILHSSFDSKIWSSVKFEVEGSPFTAYSGETDTQAIIDAVALGEMSDAPAAQWARSCTFADPGAVPFMLAYGQAEIVRLNLEQINACRAVLNHTPISFSAGVWSSTQVGKDYARQWLSGSWEITGIGKKANNPVLVACPLYAPSI